MHSGGVVKLRKKSMETVFSELGEIKVMSEMGPAIVNTEISSELRPASTPAQQSTAQTQNADCDNSMRPSAKFSSPDATANNDKYRTTPSSVRTSELLLKPPPIDFPDVVSEETIDATDLGEDTCIDISPVDVVDSSTKQSKPKIVNWEPGSNQSQTLEEMKESSAAVIRILRGNISLEPIMHDTSLVRAQEQRCFVNACVNVGMVRSMQ